ncbi:hypothetical protein [Phreatobacter sp.]|uniref:hypothetical protein n=1 Tax=Phreatobacter sp. TaxID=1966341 RepID=UPI0025F6E466|nr:hypothetical protein [Phreatobacter sp.]
MSFLSRVLLTGTTASLSSAGLLGVLAKAEGRDPVQPVNATSHWLHGEIAGHSKVLNVRYTLVGFASHYAASVFWSTVFQRLRQARPDRSPVPDALGVTALAALVDYALVPKRLTPGWESVVSPASIAIAYAALTLSFLATCPPRGR